MKYLPDNLKSETLFESRTKSNPGVIMVNVTVLIKRIKSKKLQKLRFLINFFTWILVQHNWLQNDPGKSLSYFIYWFYTE